MAVPSQAFTLVIITFSVSPCTLATKGDRAPGDRTGGACGAPLCLWGIICHMHSPRHFLHVCLVGVLCNVSGLLPISIFPLSFLLFLSGCFSVSPGEGVVEHPVCPPVTVLFLSFSDFIRVFVWASLCFLPLSQHVFVSSALACLSPCLEIYHLLGKAYHFVFKHTMVSKIS